MYCLHFFLRLNPCNVTSITPVQVFQINRTTWSNPSVRDMHTNPGDHVWGMWKWRIMKYKTAISKSEDKSQISVIKDMHATEGFFSNACTCRKWVDLLDLQRSERLWWLWYVTASSECLYYFHISRVFYDTLSINAKFNKHEINCM